MPLPPKGAHGIAQPLSRSPITSGTFARMRPIMTGSLMLNGRAHSLDVVITVVGKSYPAHTHELARCCVSRLWHRLKDTVQTCQYGSGNWGGIGIATLK
jgi:hypothetical protein